MNGQESGELAHRFLLAARGKFKLRCFDTLDAAVRFVVAHDDTVEEDDVDHYIDMLGIAEHVLDEDMAQRIARALLVFEFLQIDTKRLAAIVEYVRQELDVSYVVLVEMIGNLLHAHVQAFVGSDQERRRPTVAAVDDQRQTAD